MGREKTEHDFALHCGFLVTGNKMFYLNMKCIQ